MNVYCMQYADWFCYCGFSWIVRAYLFRATFIPAR